MLSLRKTFSLVLSLLISLALLMSSGPLSLRAESEEADLPVRERCSINEIKGSIVAPKLPELLLDSKDAKRFNKEIERYLEEVQRYFKEEKPGLESEYKVTWTAKEVGNILSLYVYIQVPETAKHAKIFF